MRPCESVSPATGGGGRLPGSHGPSNVSSLGGKGCLKVNAQGPMLTNDADRSVGPLTRPRPREAVRSGGATGAAAQRDVILSRN